MIVFFSLYFAAKAGLFVSNESKYGLFYECSFKFMGASMALELNDIGFFFSFSLLNFYLVSIDLNFGCVIGLSRSMCRTVQ